MNKIKKIKIFIVTTFLSGKGGMETVVKTVYKELERRNIEVKIVVLGKFTPSKNDVVWLRDLNFQFLLPGFPLKKILRGYLETKKLANLLRREKPDVLIGLNNGAISRLYQARKQTYPFPIFSWVHFSLKILRKLETLNKADFHLSISSGITRELGSYLRIPRERIFTVFNPTPFSLKIGEIRRPTDDCSIFLFMGRLTEQKDPIFLLNAFSKLKGNWQLHIVGDGPLKAELEERIKLLKVGGQVFLHGWKSQPWEYVRSLGPISALVLTSKNEGFPMVLLESMAHGVYCISSDCETGPEDIICENNGELFPVGNTEDLRQRLQKIINTSGSQLPSHDRIRNSIEKFALENYCDNFLAVIEKGISNFKT